MRAKEFLPEVPIDVFQPVGDFDQPGSIDDPSRKLVTNPKAVKKIRDVFKKTPYTFNFYIVNKPKSDWNKSKGIYSLDEVIKVLPELKEYLKKDPNSISIVYTTNFTNPRNFVPMTGWILAHRIAHILQIAGKGSPIRDLFFEIEADLHNLIIDINQNVYGLDLKRHKIGTGMPAMAIATDASKELLQAIATMRSARMKKLLNNADWGAELLAQYLIGGGIRFNSLPDELNSSPDKYIVGKEANQNKEKYNKLIQEFAKTTTDKFTKVFDSMVGSVFVL